MDMNSACIWRKASKSGNNGGNCVEIGTTPAGSIAAIRDSKSPERGHLTVSTGAFAAFIADVKRSHLDLP